MSPLGVFQRSAVNYFLAGSASTLLYLFFFLFLSGMQLSGLCLGTCVFLHMEICRSACSRACLHDLVSYDDVSASRAEFLYDAVPVHVLPCERELYWKMVETGTDISTDQGD